MEDKKSKDSNYLKLKDLALAEGMVLFGAADISGIRGQILLPQDLTSRLTAGVSFGYRMSTGVLDTLTTAPNQVYYFHYQRVNMLLDQTALRITALIQKNGYCALPVPASQVVDWQKQYGTLSHREIARLAGLGWYGRNNLLVNPQYGSGVRYATVLTDMPMKFDKPLKDSCGNCALCIAVCPAGAIKKESFDLALCTEQLKNFVKTEKIGQMICGLCVKACKGAGGRQKTEDGR
ncbi:MAG: reductive dehalogenase domain-containing protein [Elusimicrobiota bacterium]